MTNITWSPFVALGAMGLALSVALLDRPEVHSQSRAEWASAIEAGADHITPVDLAARLLADPNSVLLIDVRPAEDFAVFHLPASHNLSVPELLGSPGEELLAANPGRTVVLCSQGMTHPAQAWVELARRGTRDVRVLEDGLDGFVRDVLTPPSLRGVIGAQRTSQEFSQFQLARERFLARESGAQAGSTAKPAAQAAQEQAAIARLATDPNVLAQPTIVSSAWVARRGSEVVVIDAREKAEDFAAGHLPGARHVPIKAWREERNGVADELLSRDKLALAVGALSIDANTEVVAYGDEKLQDPAHVALALISLGHSKVAILEGGLTAWKFEGRTISTETTPAAAKVYVPAKVEGVKAVDLAAVKRSSEGSGPSILDVRPADAFRGEVSTEARAGHIPRSLNRPYTSDVSKTAEGLYWRPVEALRSEYQALGLRPKDPVIVSCRTGQQAAQTYFTLRYVLGYEDVRWYDGSWKEWAAKSELPVAVGEAAK